MGEENSHISFTVDATGSLNNSACESNEDLPKFELSSFKMDVEDSHVSFAVDASGSLNDSASESDSDLPRFELSLFKKYSKSESFEKPALKLSVNPEQLPKEYQSGSSLNKKRKDKTKESKWCNSNSSEITDEQKNDLMVIQMRKALDPKHFYKHSVSNAIPKHFEVGKYIESPLDFYSSRICKKQRKKTIVEELMEDAKFINYQKRKIKDFLQSQPKQLKYKNKKNRSKKKKPL